MMDYTLLRMDYAMYSLLQRSNVSRLYSERMRDEILFSDKNHSDSYWSELFMNGLKSWQHEKFKEYWLKKCISRGTESVWICIDGSNNDCQMEDSEYCEYGENKSHSGKPIVGFIYAVDAKTGEPLTYFVNPGGVVDSQAFHKIIHFLAGYNLNVEGVILDRGFCTYEDVKTLKGLGLKYVIMVPGGTYGHKQMQELYGQEIFWKTQYAIRSSGVFGISKEELIWKTHPDERGILNLFFGRVRGCFDGISLLEEVFEERERAEKQCARGEKPKIKKKFADILVVREEDEKYWVECNYEAWDKSLHSKGFFTMLSSDDFGPAFVYDTYRLRDASETQYSILKSQEGYDTTRVHTDAGMLSKYAICFVSSILRYWIMKSCKRHKLNTNEMIQKMDRIRLLVNDGGKVIFIRDMSQDSQDLFSEFGMDKESFEAIARDYNNRAQTKIKSEIREMPDFKDHRPQEKPKRGRPPGRKNNKTLAREAAHAKEGKEDDKQKTAKKRGRPVGAKDSHPRKKRSDAGIRRGPRNKSK